MGAAIAALGEADTLRLQRAARYFTGGTRIEWKDLLQEAFTRTLDGSRRCPVNVNVVAFLRNVMRSLVSAERGSQALQPPTVSLEATGTEGLPLQVPAPGRTVEEALVASDDYAERLASLEALFSDDEDAHMVVMADKDGVSAAEIREMMGWSERQLATVRTRIRRAMLRRWPSGYPA